MSKCYRLSPVGRRDNLLMIIVAMILWIFAVWSIASTLQLRLHPAVFWSDLQRVFIQPPTIEQAVPALLMLVLIVATPLMIWNLIAEWDATFRLTNEGLEYQTLGFRLCYHWHNILAIQPQSTADEAVAIVCRYDPVDALKNPLRRWLHQQMHGRQRLLIGPGIERRAELLQAIEQAMVAAQSSTTQQPPVYR
ncbi:hypothetical protein [Chloroflexus sp. Y-396-1]|uniref:hypothetical protein n=1 Tax=Chloroflexus sp. Y-396-1 TaxID=867845 RepID=UPI00048FCD43|nr:hypothetical protein [Chloroflexus sp. Y-396-1]